MFVNLSGRSSTSKACSGSRRQPGIFRRPGAQVAHGPRNSRRRGLLRRLTAPRPASRASPAGLERSAASQFEAAVCRGNRACSGSHKSISLGLSRRRDTKKPRPDGGVLGSVLRAVVARRSYVPGRGSFFDSAAMHGFVIIRGGRPARTTQSNGMEPFSARRIFSIAAGRPATRAARL